MAISTNQKPTIYRNLYENTGPERHLLGWERVSNGQQWPAWVVEQPVVRVEINEVVAAPPSKDNPLPTDFSYINFYPLEVVSR